MASRIPASSLAGGGGPVGEKREGVRADLRVVSGLEMVAHSGGSMEGADGGGPLQCCGALLA